MKIVNKDTFLLMPRGTLFSLYQPQVIDDIEIKGDTLKHNDYTYQSISDGIKSNGSEDDDRILTDALQNGSSFEMDFDNEGRDGTYDNKEMFVIWEKVDVEKLIVRLKETLLEGYE